MNSGPIFPRVLTRLELDYLWNVTNTWTLDGIQLNLQFLRQLIISGGDKDGAAVTADKRSNILHGTLHFLCLGSLSETLAFI